MATFTITTAVNIDTLASKAGSDTYNINGGYLTVDQDTRYGTNQNTSAAMGNITLSATLGGTIEFKSTGVRLIPYNTGSGNVPAYDTVISQGSASGKLIGVYSALNAAPTAVGNAMPASGYIKIRQWNSVAYTSGALTGISASATGADVAGWLEIVGVDALLATCNRLGTFKVTGDFYDLGTTDGTRATTYQIPSNGSSAFYLPGVEVETGSGTGVYEWYPCAGSKTALLANIGTEEVRGKFCWISTAGLLRFGHDGTNSTGGYIPPSGRKIRIPNIFFMCCTAATPTANVIPNATPGTRFEFATTGGGVIDMSKASCNWYLNMSQPFSVALSHVSTFGAIILSECASAITWDYVCVGQEAATTLTPLTVSVHLSGGSISNSVFSRSAQGSSGHYLGAFIDVDGLDLTNCWFPSLTFRANSTTGTLTLTRVANGVFTNVKLGGGRALQTTCSNLQWDDTVYIDTPAGTTGTSIPQGVWDVITNTTDILMDGLSFGGLKVQPYTNILNVQAAGCARLRLRNLGTYASPLDMGGAQQDGVSWSRTTTTATVTKVGHGLKTNDIVYVIISSDTAAITVASKTVASTPTADTFTFSCTNGGATSGTLSYYLATTGQLVTFASTATATDVSIQRCYTLHFRNTVQISGDNTVKDLTMESVFNDFQLAPVANFLELFYKGCSSAPSLTAQTAIYGSHFQDYFIKPVTSNLSAQSWSRTTTTATVTSNSHGLRTGMIINVTVSSDTAAIVLGLKTVTVLTANTFTFTCLNAGGASGTLTYEDQSGRIALMMNEETANTQGTVDFDAGTPNFTSAGGLYMPVVGDQVTFITPDYIIGHTGFAIAEPIMAGGVQVRYDITYAIDKNNGSGYGSFKNLYYPRAGGSGTSGQFTFTVTDATGVAVDDYVWGTGIAPLAKVTNIAGNTITVDKANTATVSGTIRFGAAIANETGIDAELGFKLKVRIKTNTTDTAAITSLYLSTKSTDTSRAYTYPLDLATLTLTGLVSGSDIVVLAPGTSTEYDNVDANSGSTYGFVYDAGVVSAVDICVYKAGYVPFFIRNLTVTASGGSVPVQQVADRAYLL